MSPQQQERDKEPELTDDERRKLRQIISKDEKVRWLSGLIRAWGAWVAGGLLATMALGSTIRDGVKEWLR